MGNERAARSQDNRWRSIGMPSSSSPQNRRWGAVPLSRQVALTHQGHLKPSTDSSGSRPFGVLGTSGELAGQLSSLAPLWVLPCSDF